MALLIKFKPDDDGSRPITPCDSSNAYWVSPNIFMTVPAGGGGVTDIGGTVTEGQEVTLNVRLWNTGNAPTGKARVQIWVSDFTTLPHPNFTALELQPGVTTSSGSVASVPAGVAGPGIAVAGDVKWKVTDGQAASLGNHVCLVANCFLDDGSEGAEGTPASSPFFDPINNTSDFCKNPHHAQRNVTVTPVQHIAGEPPPRTHVPIVVTNPSPGNPRPVHLQMSQQRPRVITPFERHLLDHSVARGLKLQPSTNDPISFGLISPDRRHSRTVYTRSGVPDLQELKFELEPGGKAQVQITAELHPKDQVGFFHTFDIVERNEKGSILGGARVFAVLVPTLP